MPYTENKIINVPHKKIYYLSILIIRTDEDTNGHNFQSLRILAGMNFESLSIANRLKGETFYNSSL